MLPCRFRLLIDMLCMVSMYVSILTHLQIFSSEVQRRTDSERNNPMGTTRHTGMIAEEKFFHFHFLETAKHLPHTIAIANDT